MNALSIIGAIIFGTPLAFFVLFSISEALKDLYSAKFETKFFIVWGPGFFMLVSGGLYRETQKGHAGTVGESVASHVIFKTAILAGPEKDEQNNRTLQRTLTPIRNP